MPSEYQTALESLMLTHFEADSIPCEEFTAIFTAWQAKKTLTGAEIRADLCTVLDDTDDLPAALITAIEGFLVARQGAKDVKKGSKKTTEKVEKTEKIEKIEKTEKTEKASKKGGKPVKEPKVETVKPVEQPKVETVKPVETVKEAETVKAVETVKPVKAKKTKKTAAAAVVETPTLEPSAGVVEPSAAVEMPARALNAVALFSRIVSLIQKPGDYARALAPLAGQRYTLHNGFKPESKLYGELAEKGVLSWVGQEQTLQGLIEGVANTLAKPAVISVSAVVRWFLTAADQMAIAEQYAALQLPIAVKPKADKGKKADKADKGKKAEKAVKALKPKRAAQGYALFTQRVGQVLKNPDDPFGANRITLTDSQSEAARAAAALKGKPTFASLLASHNLTLGGEYALGELLLKLNTEKQTVVRLSGILWSMCDSATRARIIA